MEAPFLEWLQIKKHTVGIFTRDFIIEVLTFFLPSYLYMSLVCPQYTKYYWVNAYPRSIIIVWKWSLMRMWSLYLGMSPLGSFHIIGVCKWHQSFLKLSLTYIPYQIAWLWRWFELLTLGSKVLMMRCHWVESSSPGGL